MTSAQIETESLFTEGYSQSKAIITLTIKNFCKFKDPVRSPPYMIHYLPWRIKIQCEKSKEDPEQKSLAFYVECNRDSGYSSWSCYANVCLTMVSQMEGIDDRTLNFHHLFSSKENNWGYKEFLKWDEALDAKKGFIKNNTIIFQATVNADLPRGITSNCPISQNFFTKVADSSDHIAENLTSLEAFMTDLKAATEKGDINCVECLLIQNRARISVLNSIPVDYVAESIEGQLEETLELVESEVNNAENFLKSNKNASTDSPFNASSCSVLIDWKPVPFDGKKDDWCQWWKNFESVINSNVAIDDEVKMKVLTACLKTEGSDILGDMPRTGENYKKAVALLQSQFVDALNLRQTYYNQLELLTPASDINSQRETVNKLRPIIQNLDELRGKLPVDDQLITRNIIQNFPEGVLRVALHDLKGSKQGTVFNPTPAELLVGLENYLEVEEFIAAHKV